MISIIQYLTEMLAGEGSDYDENGNPTPEHFKALARLKARNTQREIDSRNTGIGKKIIKKVIPIQQEGTEPGTIIKPIKKIIDATQQ